jgi:hypothetical protein
MGIRDLLDVGCTGAMLAVVLRWVLRLDVELHWAVCIGATSLLLEPWLSLHFGPQATAPTVSDLAVGTGVALAFLAVAQAVQERWVARPAGGGFARRFNS